jgi:hypothetical protein
MSQTEAWKGRNPPPDDVNQGFPDWFANESPAKPDGPKPYAAIPSTATVQDFRNIIGLLQTRVKELESKQRTFTQQTERMQSFEVTMKQFIDRHNLEMQSLIDMIERELGPSTEQEPNTDVAEESPVEIGDKPEGQDDNAE